MVTLQEDSQYFLCYDKETDPGAKVPRPTIAPQYSGKLPMNPICMTGIGMTGIGMTGIGMTGFGVAGISVAGFQSFDQPAEEMFAAFLDKELIGQWMFGPLLRKEEVLGITLDGRGGRSLFWSAAMIRRLIMWANRRPYINPDGWCIAGTLAPIMPTVAGSR